MPNTLYVVGAPVSDRGDLTLRARRILREVACVAATELDQARRLLARLDLEAPLCAAGDRVGVWSALDRGDVALLFSGEMPGPSSTDLALIRAAVERGLAVVPVPGPVPPITALVVSGLPADSFVFLGRVPAQPAARRALLAAVAAGRRTLVALESQDRLAITLADLDNAFGDRPLVVFLTFEPQPGWIWRGTLAAAVAQGIPDLPPGHCILVVGGLRAEESAWDEERLRAEVAACLDEGLRAREIGQQLAARSGWSRRDIYRLAVEQAQQPANGRKET
jgi:16S rRNA (cytidine1402-2'-O)-methyltransferase